MPIPVLTPDGETGSVFQNAFKLDNLAAPKPAGILSMQRSKKEMHDILQELKSFFQDCYGQRDARVVNDCLEPVGKRFDTELKEKVADIVRR